MKIEINGEKTLTLTNEQMDNDNYVELYYNGECITDICIDELLAAVQSFVNLRESYSKRNNLLK